MPGKLSHELLQYAVGILSLTLSFHLSGIECMAQDCNILVPEDFVLGMLTKSNHRERYQQFAFTDYVKVSRILALLIGHPHLVN